MKKLLLISVCLAMLTGILHAKVTQPVPNTTQYKEYKTSVDKTCTNKNFHAFTIDSSSNIYIL